MFHLPSPSYLDPPVSEAEQDERKRTCADDDVEIVHIRQPSIRERACRAGRTELSRNLRVRLDVPEPIRETGDDEEGASEHGIAPFVRVLDDGARDEIGRASCRERV